MDAKQLAVDPTQSAPIYLQIYQRFRDAIGNGHLQPGDRVPAIRSLASELNVARGTVEAAYQLLIGEGYFLPRGPAGTVISPQIQLAHVTTRTKAAEPLGPLNAFKQIPKPLHMGLPALDAFPKALWSRLGARRLRMQNTNDLLYPDHSGLASLRTQIATYLRISRGINCTPHQVIICSGYANGLDLIHRVLGEGNKRCWYEDPGYFIAREHLQFLGYETVPIPVDEDGMNVEYALKHGGKASYAVVTPMHQSPLGLPLSLPRRLALLEWARSNGSWIIEDDYDSEYRYVSRPLPALQSLDTAGRVIYAGSFSKVLFPGLRLSYLVVPAAQAEAFAASAYRLRNGPPELLQATVSDFMEQGHFALHLKKMRNLYAQRRQLLVDALYAECADGIHINPHAGGMHLVVRLTKRDDDTAAAVLARMDGLAIHSLREWTQKHDPGAGLIMSFTNVTTTKQARELAGQVCRAINA